MVIILNNLSFNEREEKKNIVIKLKKYYESEKYNTFIREVTDYLSKYPTDEKMLFKRAKAYRKLGLFKESITDLKQLMSFGFNKYAIFQLYLNYFYLGMYEEALELLPIIYNEIDVDKYFLCQTELIMKTELGIKMNFNSNISSFYSMQQVLNYDEKKALDHINKHLSSKDEKVFFSDKINVNKLFKIIRDKIDNNKKINTYDSMEIHYYMIPGIGYVDGFLCNTLKVINVPNTNNIINMYPTLESDQKFEILDIDYGQIYKDKEQTNQKVKTMSRAERFNQKYKKV